MKIPVMNSNRKIACSTHRGFWKNVSSPNPVCKESHIWMHVDTGSFEFMCTPKYFITLFGNNNYWMINCADAVYNAGKSGFDVYLKLPDGFMVEDISSNQEASFADFANQEEWGIYWFALEISYRAPIVFEALQAAS
jgi:hypothetical protein